MIQRFDVGDRLSEMAVHQGVAYLAGQVAADGSVDMTGQTQQVLAAVDALLVRAGTDKSRILRAEIYLADLADFAAMNAAYAEFFSAPAPARTTIQAARLPRDIQVEIDVVAAL